MTKLSFSNLILPLFNVSFILSCFSFLNAVYVLCKALWIAVLKGAIEINLPDIIWINVMVVEAG